MKGKLGLWAECNGLLSCHGLHWEAVESSLQGFNNKVERVGYMVAWGVGWVHSILALECNQQEAVGSGDPETF